jgi:hypothetical protein
MAKILRISESDYRIKVQSGGDITLDTGSNEGTVTVTGNLVIQGDYTTINVADMQVEDNILLLNKDGGDAQGVLAALGGVSGIEIDRGDLDNAQFLWDESVDKFVVRTTDGNTSELAGLQVGNLSTTSSSSYLSFDMQDGATVLRITNSTGYESRVLDDNDIPNRKYISDYVYAFGGSAVVSRFQFPVNAAYGNQDTLGEALSSSIKLWVRSGGTLNKRVEINSAGVDIDNINIFGATINNTGLNPSFNSNLILSSQNNQIQINGIINLDDKSAPSATGGTSRIYSRSATAASNFELYNSGVFVANSRIQDELVVKNRALLLSMLF